MSEMLDKQIFTLPAQESVVTDPFTSKPSHYGEDPATEPAGTLSLREKFLLGALALVLHGAGLHWVANRDTVEPPVEPPEVPPMVIEFAAAPPPPVEEPPEPEPEPTPEPVVEPPPPVEELAVKPPPPPKPKPPPPRPVPPPPPVETPPPVSVPPAAVETPPTPPVPASPPPAEPAPITPPTANAGYLRNPAPAYPAIAQRRNWEGTVELRVHVLANGRPSEIQIQTSSGRQALDAAAVQAVQKWTFVPAKQGDRTLDGWVTVPIDFRLN